ncbi:MAG: pentapeptide repeat-containing protein [Sphingomonas sp.]
MTVWTPVIRLWHWARNRSPVCRSDDSGRAKQSPLFAEAAEARMQKSDTRQKPLLSPNMICIAQDATSSTFSNITAGHSIFGASSFFNSAFHRSNFESTHFSACEFDGAVIENCSLRAVQLKNCDVDGLVIDGINIGSLLKLLLVK